ncbi:MAG: complex I NDUFA9 subunit family protein [Burkholderiaceae bacterium]|nr:complex I NDUFA9 subunit family protein [Burkholderiaceae bacterium]
MKRIVITGGTGFVGRSICEHLVEHDAGCRLVVPTRRLAGSHPLQVLPTVDLVQADVHDAKAITPLLEGADALVQLVAILHGSAEDFDRVHVQLQRTLAAACTAAGVRRVVQVSALAVGPQAPSNYLRSKAAGEAVWQAWGRSSGGALTVLRPSVIFGAEDRFTNLFARLQRLFPVLPLAGSGAKFQPVWVGDVAQAVVESLAGGHAAGPVIECAGPDVMTLEQIVQRVGAMAGCRRPVLPLPEAAGMLQAAAMGVLPGEPLMSRDNVLSMRVPSVAGGTLPGLAALGIDPAPLEILAGHFSPADPRRR